MWVVNHFKIQHGKVLVRYSCRLCGKHSKMGHSIACHIPKCSGNIGRRPRPGGVLCGECGAGFVSNRALSTHERHVHPNTRKNKRSHQALVGLRAFEEKEVSRPKIPRRQKEMDHPTQDTLNLSVPQQTLTLPEGGLLHSLQEAARQMVGRAGGDEEGIQVLSAWLEGADQVPDLVENLACGVLQELGATRYRIPTVRPTGTRRDEVPQGDLRSTIIS